MTFSKIYECHDEGEISFIISLLEGNGITYIVENQHFGSLYPGVTIPFNGRNILVPDEDVDRVQILLSRLKDAPKDNAAG